MDAEMLEFLIEGHQNTGNILFRRKQYGRAAQSYSSGLVIAPKNINLLSNRAACYLQIGLYAKALKDSEEVLLQTPSHEKCLFRKVRSLWGLKKYQDAIDFIKKAIPVGLLKKNSELKRLEQKSSKLLEQSLGNIEILDLMKLPKEQRNDVGEYTGPVRIAEIPGKGRGLLATKEITPGQILICSKAFCIVFNEDVKVFKEAIKEANGVEVEDWSSEKCCSALITDMLETEPNVRKAFFELYPGHDHENTKFSYEDFEERKNYETVFTLVSSIIKYNGFKSEQETNPWGNEGTDFFGLWILPSYLNHSCSDSNAFFSTFGDVMIVRAVKGIQKDEEVTISYWSPKIPYTTRLGVMKARKFSCHCRACQMKKNEPIEISEQVQKILQLIQKGVADNDDDDLSLSLQLERIEKLISLREKDYAQTNFDLLDISIETVCGKLFEKEQWKRKSIFITEKMHETTTNNCFVMSSVYLSVNIFLNYWELQLQEHEKLAHWWKQLKLNAIAAFGSTDGLIGLLRNDGSSLMTRDQIDDFNELELLTGFQDVAVNVRR